MLCTLTKRGFHLTQFGFGLIGLILTPINLSLSVKNKKMLCLLYMKTKKRKEKEITKKIFVETHKDRKKKKFANWAHTRRDTMLAKGKTMVLPI
jgi:hypothetical protein